MRTSSLLVLGTVLVLLGACSGARELPVAERGAVALGMTREEVEKVLGEPDARSQIDEHAIGYIYHCDKPERPDGLVEASEVEFDAQGRVVAVHAVWAGVGQ